MRWAEVTGLSSRRLSEGSLKRALAISFTMSTSKPSSLFVRGLRYPNRGWSCFTPAISLPRCTIFAIWLPAG